MITVNTQYSTYKDCYLDIKQYQYDGSVCVQIMNQTDGAIARITTCIPDCSSSLDNDESFIDLNNCPWALDFIKKYNLGTVTDKYGYSGFCKYPVVKWDINELNSHKL